MISPDSFLAVADQQITAPRKAQQRAAEKRAAKKAHQKEQLSAAYRRWREEQREALLAGAHGDAARDLIGFLDGMTLRDGAALLGHIETFRGADADTRFEIVSLIDIAIVEMRERHGLAPFDDPLPDEPPNVFFLIREALS